MSAAEVIEMIEKLPPREKAEVFAYLKKSELALTERTVRYLPKTEADCIAEQVFKDHNELFRKLAQ